MVSTHTPTSQIEPYKFEVGKIELLPMSPYGAPLDPNYIIQIQNDLSHMEVAAGTPVIITLPVKNIGSEMNVYRATLTVNGENKGTKDIILAPSDNGSLEYDLKLNNEGTYNLAIADTNTTLKVYRAEDIQIHVPELFEREQTKFCITSPKYPFIIRNIEFRPPLPESFKILDETGKELYDSDNASLVSEIEVDSDFCIELAGVSASYEWQSCGTNCGSILVSHFTGVASVSGIHKIYAP